MKQMKQKGASLEKAGKLIVIDGTDGSGKATQTRELVKRLELEGREVATIDFPRYYDNFFGKLVGECLAGEHGDWAAMDPRIASVIYAADRFESATQVRKWLEEGKVVICDRYVSSNQIHQGGKISDDKKRKEFLDWLDRMEFEVFGIPRPDAIVYLDVPLDFSLKLMENEDKNVKKKYLKGKKDAHEKDLEHLKKAKDSAMKIIAKKNNWLRINCVERKKLLSIEAVHGKLWEKLAELI